MKVISSERIKMIACACGCGVEFEEKDAHGRRRKYVSGHNGRKYSDPSQHKREWNHRNRKARYNYKLSYGRDRKAKLIKIKGGKCKKCGIGYDDTNGSIFQFHHTNPEDKMFPLTIATMINRKWSDILIELEKCELVCSNSHFLIHSSPY